MSDMRVTCEEAVRALKRIKTTADARQIAAALAASPRAVATALRQATNDGRVSIRFKKGLALYRFKRLTPGCGVTGS